MSRGATRREGPRTDNSAGSEHSEMRYTEAKQGAIQSKTSFSQHLRSYWAHHRASMLGSLQRLLAAPLQTLMTSLVVAIALALPSGLLIVLGNLQQLSEMWDSSPKVSLYLEKRVRPKAVENLINRIENLQGVADIEWLTADEALREFQLQSGFGDVLGALEDNPLPDTLIISPKSAYVHPDKLSALAEQMAGLPLVDDVSLDLAWVKKMAQLMRLGERIVIGLAVLLSLGVLLTLGNTIRLAIENRRDEIIVCKLVGGTNGFVSRPLLYMGFWYGFLGGLLACIIIELGFHFLQAPIASLMLLYQSDFAFASLDLSAALLLLAFGGGLGWLGSQLAISRHLHKMEPN